jgi:hypothetical protein
MSATASENSDGLNLQVDKPSARHLGSCKLYGLSFVSLGQSIVVENEAFELKVPPSGISASRMPQHGASGHIGQAGWMWEPEKELCANHFKSP